VIWGSVFVPFLGNWLIVILSSVVYYAWKNECPNKANKINRHGWLAFLAGHALWLALIFGLGALSNA
jgi:hypothetical protein